MEKLRKTNTSEVKRFKKWLNPEKESSLIDIFIYEKDSVFLKDMLKKIRHVAFIKAIIKFLAAHNDSEVPELILNFSRKKYSKGYRSSLLLLLEKYDCTLYIYDILELFLKDSYNTTWYAYDILVKYLKKINLKDLKKISSILNIHINKEKDIEKREYHELFLKKVDNQIKKITKEKNI